MTSFSNQRFLSFLQLKFVFLSAFLVTNPLPAQSNEDLFEGTWLIDTPAKGALIMLVKSQGRASYFWGDDADRSVYKGTWIGSNESATLAWMDGSKHRIQRNGLGFDATQIDASGQENYTTQAQQVPQEILGQWAKPPTKENQVTSDRDQAKGFFGIWKIGKDGDTSHYIFVESDRSAACSKGDLRGSWDKQGSELHISWDSGHYSILRENQRSYAYKQIEPGKIIENDKTDLVAAARVNEDQVPHTWATNYKKEREAYSGGIAFTSRKNARTFYRGAWIVQLSENSFERIRIERFGGLKTSLDSTLEGDWRMSGQDIFMRWDDGMRKILSPMGRGFVLYEYKPSRPLDGVPTRIRAAAPIDSSKLEDHLKDRAAVAEQIINLARAAGIDSTQPDKTDWGRTFGRWVWPFSEDSSDISSDAILNEEFEGANPSDPWWWPFWSERSIDAANTALPGADLATNKETAESFEIIETTTIKDKATTDEKLEETTVEPPKRKSVGNWSWPF